MDTILFNIPRKLKKDFQMVALVNDTTMTDMLVGFIREVVKNEVADNTRDNRGIEGNNGQ